MKKLNKTQKNISILIIFCLFLLAIRMKITNSIFFGFLIWNLFLALVPYIISTKLKKFNLQNTSKIKLSSIIFIWLIFLPNAPYIITDFIHLHHSKSTLIWLDIFMLFSFASTGLLLAIISLNDIFKLIKQKWNSKIAHIFIIASTFLCGFGIYLGRFLRFNSWDLFTKPIHIIKTSFLSFYDLKTWFITFGFGFFLYILHTITHNIRKSYCA